MTPDPNCPRCHGTGIFRPTMAPTDELPCACYIIAHRCEKPPSDVDNYVNMILSNRRSSRLDSLLGELIKAVQRADATKIEAEAVTWSGWPEKQSAMRYARDLIDPDRED